MTAILLTDIYSHFRKGYRYGRKGERVEVIRYADDVCAVKGERECFSVRTEKLKFIENGKQSI